MSVDVDSSSTDWTEWTQQVKAFHRTEPKYHLISRYHDECLDIRHSIIVAINISILFVLVLLLLLLLYPR